ncbi:MAG: hypothetical protein AB8G23_20250 [Myxococcota bacterium]
MGEKRVPDLEEILQQEAEAPIPEPRADLQSLAIRRVRAWILMNDLVRWATLEGVWTSLNRHAGDARGGQERQDS